MKITATGKEVLAGNANWLNITELDHWIGGVHLDRNNIWPWDENKEQLRHLRDLSS